MTDGRGRSCEGGDYILAAALQFVLRRRNIFAFGEKHFSMLCFPAALSLAFGDLISYLTKTDSKGAGDGILWFRESSKYRTGKIVSLGPVGTFFGVLGFC